MIKYIFHDSLIETVNYFSDEKRLEIGIELCNWLQKDYNDSDPETLNICMIFEEVDIYELSIKNYKFNTNEILDVIYMGNNTIKIIFLTENDAETIVVTSKKIRYVSD